MSSQNPSLRDFIYLDSERVLSLASQLRIGTVQGAPELSKRADLERLFLALEPALVARGGVAQLDESFDYAQWTPEHFADGQIVRASGAVRMLDFSWISQALSGLPAVLRKMSKLELDALRNSEEGRRMSKQQLQQRSQENQVAIGKVEDYKMDELTEAITKLYGDVIRIKITPSQENPRAVLVGSTYSEYFYDSRAALTQKYGVEVRAGWTVLGQLNMPGQSGPLQPIPIGNQMEDAFEQIAMLMNNAFKLANSPAFPTVSFTPIAIYRGIK